MTNDTSSQTATGKQGSRLGRIILWLFLGPILGIAMLVGSLWTYGAIYFDGPAGIGPGNQVLAISWVLATAALMIRFRRQRKWLPVWLICFAVVLIPWRP